MALTSREDAFTQLIEQSLPAKRLTFAERYYVAVSRHYCRNKAPLPEKCIDEGRDEYSNFMQGLKTAKQQAYYCMNACKDKPDCLLQCKNTLRQTADTLYGKLSPVLDDYLLGFYKE